eukprot:CAMPEP_0184295440 /NCGR_PEP_ID=MMETSP1049-20130417/6275_1 /TAXON_ID=77928 /ORGANISM="Proteomonas sulcata, Strain CCMP704" /LENGTH=140 /DNA_ID=CAMNT_0026603939 /DNA_START=224 /DNA_END=647 /DNA_ORIENTATION=+
MPGTLREWTSLRAETTLKGEFLVDKHAKVNSPQKCLDLVTRAVPKEALNPQPLDIMQRRANGLRWEALMAITSSKRSSSSREIETKQPAEFLEEALEAERRSAKTEAARLRAERRAERLRGVVDRPLLVPHPSTSGDATG